MYFKIKVCFDYQEENDSIIKNNEILNILHGSFMEQCQEIQKDLVCYEPEIQSTEKNDDKIVTIFAIDIEAEPVDIEEPTFLQYHKTNFLKNKIDYLNEIDTKISQK